MGKVLQQGLTAAIPDFNQRIPGAPNACHILVRPMPDHLIPACLGTNIFVVTGNIRGRGQGKGGVGWSRQTQNPTRGRTQETSGGRQ